VVLVDRLVDDLPVDDHYHVARVHLQVGGVHNSTPESCVAARVRRGAVAAEGSVRGPRPRDQMKSAAATTTVPWTAAAAAAEATDDRRRPMTGDEKRRP